MRMIRFLLEWYLQREKDIQWSYSLNIINIQRKHFPKFPIKIVSVLLLFTRAWCNLCKTALFSRGLSQLHTQQQVKWNQISLSVALYTWDHRLGSLSCVAWWISGGRTKNLIFQSYFLRILVRRMVFHYLILKTKVRKELDFYQKPPSKQVCPFSTTAVRSITWSTSKGPHNRYHKISIWRLSFLGRNLLRYGNIKEERQFIQKEKYFNESQIDCKWLQKKLMVWTKYIKILCAYTVYKSSSHPPYLE